ncbi:hypothetical protein EDEG_02911 [Edhazardia aedis USNM 41457]|uniref:Uncharacterized protein n=1 Tax=Edhazardia aedis (strain USNM 41457) TaxID=1003232 RepID=J9D576_EDHAE|nr:hypothetical protein EDEG_02911 [Edhazardia aedis USNM 41457]|eukprot:EJW02679.1 hypothetical protein EDEG_02911 [Edhazardia aedis USNM 41457]
MYLDLSGKVVLTICAVIISVILLGFLCGYFILQYMRKRHIKNTNQIFNDSYEKIIQSGEVSNFDAVEYLQTNLSLQEEIWEDKIRLDSKNYVKPTIKTIRHTEMIFDLKRQFWKIALRMLELEFQGCKRDEETEIKGAFFFELKKNIQKHFSAELFAKRMFFPTLNYIKLFNMLLKVYKLIFDNLETKYKIDDSVKNNSSSLITEMTQKIDFLQAEHKITPKTLSAFDSGTVNEISSVNLAILNVMEKYLLGFFAFIKKLETITK